MKTRICPLPKTFVTLCVLLLANMFLVGHADGFWIRGISSNFDLHNFAKEEVNGLVVTLGGIEPQDVVRLYAGPLSRGWTPLMKGGDGEVIIHWRAPQGTGLRHCEWVHLGLSLRAGAKSVKYAEAAWTLDGEPIAAVPFV